MFVLHQAALPSVPRSIADPLETHRHCATGTLNVLIAARDAGVKAPGLRRLSLQPTVIKRATPKSNR